MGANKKVYGVSSSNLIKWEGEDVPCIKICKGDMVSDIVYKLGMEICAIQAAYNLDSLDLKCVVDKCISCPDPEKTLKIVLQLIINKVCSISDIISGLSGSSEDPSEKLLSVASCFLPMTNSEGDPITKLLHSDYTKLIASLVCNHTSRLNGIDIALSELEEEYASLSSRVTDLSGIPKVSPKCVAPTNSPIEITVAWQLLEKDFCEIKTILGSPDALSKASGMQMKDLTILPRLSGKGTMSSYPDWKPSTSTLADSFYNLWITVNDMRSAVNYITENCCKVGCDSIIVDFDIKLNDARSETTLFFYPKSKIPTGFTDCDSRGNKLTITDSAGASTEVFIKIKDVQDDVEGFIVDLSGTPLDPNLDYSYNMEACMTDGALTCQKCINKFVTYKDTCAYCEISVVAGHDGNIDGELVIIYEN